MSSNFFVNHTNPEIFNAIPRPGGIVNIQIPERKTARRAKPASGSGSKVRSSSRSKSGSRTKGKPSSKTSAGAASRASATSTSTRKSILTVSEKYDAPVDLDVDSCPRDYKVKQIIAATPWSVEFDEYLEPSEESKRIPDPFQDSVDMLAMTISVIMLLSTGYDKMSESHFKWVLSYLDCINDEFGHTPPNVQGILNHINKVTGGKIKSFLDEEDPDELDEDKKAVSFAGHQVVTPNEQPPAESEAEAEE